MIWPQTQDPADPNRLASPTGIPKVSRVPEDDAKQDRWSADQWEESIRAVFRRSLEDRAFRKLAKSEPLKAIEQATGAAPPADLKVRFVESLEERTFVLPKTDAPYRQYSEVDISRILYHCYRSQAVLPDNP